MSSRITFLSVAFQNADPAPLFSSPAPSLSELCGPLLSSYVFILISLHSTLFDAPLHGSPLLSFLIFSLFTSYFCVRFLPFFQTF